MGTPFEIGDTVRMRHDYAMAKDISCAITTALENNLCTVEDLDFPFVILNNGKGARVKTLPDILEKVSEEPTMWDLKVDVDSMTIRGLGTFGSPLGNPCSEESYHTAKDVIHEIAETLASRGKSRDNGQERSMARTVRTFNAMTDHELTEEDGWLFMQYLKDSRSRSGDYSFDDYLDKAGYAVLAAECADREASQ